MSYRILEKDGKFYPQFFFLFWWFKYGELYGKTKVEIMASRDICFKSLEEAKFFLNKKTWPKKIPEIKIHPYP